MLKALGMLIAIITGQSVWLIPNVDYNVNQLDKSYVFKADKETGLREIGK